MTTRELAPRAPTRTYSDIMRGEIKAECARRDITQSGVAALLGLSQPAVSDRWRGRTPWSLNEIERLESVLGLSRGALLFACARRDSNPQPSDLSPLEVFVGLAASACQIDHNRVTECDECGRCIACDECRCYDSNWWERVDVEFEDLVARALQAGHDGDCTYPTSCGTCGRCLACQCACWDWAEHDNLAATTPGVQGGHEECCEHEECDDTGGGCRYTTDEDQDVEVWEQDDEDEARRGQCVICSGDCEPGHCVVFADHVSVRASKGAWELGDEDEDYEWDENDWQLDDVAASAVVDAWELAA